MAPSDLRGWAVKGAEQRLLEIAEEARAIFQAFPELREQGRGFDLQPAGTPGTKASARRTSTRRTRRPRRPMSAAERKAVGARMKKYWAERRKAAAKNK
jgi:hypothetical protein